MTKQVCVYYSMRKVEERGEMEVAVVATPEFGLVRKRNGLLVSYKSMLKEYALGLKHKENKLCRLLETYLWIHRELLSCHPNPIL